MPISGRSACELGFGGIGLTFGAISSGITGGTMTAPAMLLGGAVGYLVGKAVCRIPAVRRAVDRALGLGDWAGLEVVLSNPPVRREAVALIVEEVGVGPVRAEQIWDGVVAVMKADPRAVLGSASFQAAAHHPATGPARHGIAVLNITSSRAA